MATRKGGKRKTTARGQQKIAPERAQEIQAALIREHYLSGEPAGSWNEATEEAMRRYQGAHGWQTKIVPDSRALIALGLGPNHDHLLNPETAMTTQPATASAAPRATATTPSPKGADPATPAAAAKGAEPAASAPPTSTTNPAPASDPPPASTSAHDPSGPQ